MRILFALLLVALCWRGEEARAHAVLLTTEPADRAVVAQAPAEIVLRFNEAVDPISVQVLDGSGVAVTAMVRRVDHEVRIVPVRPLAEGSYIVSYRVTSADAHPIGGSFLFAIGAALEAWREPAARESAEASWRLAAAVNRAFHLAAVMIAIGGLLYLLLLSPDPHRPLRPVLLGAAAVGIVTPLAAIPLQGGVLLDAPAARLLDPELWRVGFVSTRGIASLIAAAGLAVAAFALATAAINRPLAILGGVAVIASFAVSGHAATAPPRWIAIPTLLLHVAVAAFWIGSLMPLLTALNAPATQRVRAVRRFSDLALVIVPQLVVAGAILAALQIQRTAALFETDYGLTLLIKLALVAALLILAACNRWILIPEMTEGVPGHAVRLRRTIRAELALGAAILCVTAFLSQTVPPRSIAAAEASMAAQTEGHTSVIIGREYKALLMVTPARPGGNEIKVRIFDADERPIDPIEIAVELSRPDAAIEPLRRALARAGDGYFTLTGPELGIGGRWIVRIEVLVTDFDKAVFETEIFVR